MSERKRTPAKSRGIFEKAKGSGVWWISYKDAAGQRHREKCGTRSMALALVEKRRQERRQGKKLPELLRSKPVLFADIASRALTYSQAHKRSFDADRQRMPLLLEWFGPRPAAGIASGEIEQRLTAAAGAREWTPATVNRYRSLLSLAYSLAIKDGKVPVNPVRGVRQLTENNLKERFLSQPEEDRLKAAICARHPEYWAAVVLAINTGIRRSEQFGMRWEHINFERRVLTIPRSKHGEARHVPLNSVALMALEQLRMQASGSEWVIPRSSGEDRQSAENIRHSFERACREAHVNGFTWHCLRHTFASRLVMAGVDLRTVQRLMGHKRIATTERYAHLSPEHELAAVEKLIPASPGGEVAPKVAPDEFPPNGGFAQGLATAIQ